MTTVKDIYDFLNGEFPFEKQESYDNSGLIAGSANGTVTGIVTCLDITAKVVDEALKLGAELIVSHHPVIFDPIRRLPADSVVYKLAAGRLSAICCHTNADIADNGTNGAAYDLLKDSLKLGEKEVLEKLFPDGSGIGWVCSCEEITPRQLAARLKESFGCSIRYTNGREKINRIAFCSGSGGSLIGLIKDSSCALVTGDIKHNIFVEAENRRLSVFDCTHYSTEILFAQRAAELISDKFSDIKVTVSEKGKEYIFWE